MKKEKKVFQRILLCAAGALCILCAGTMWMLNDSFAAGFVEEACLANTYCGLYDIETEEVLFFGGCIQYFNGACACMAKEVVDNVLVGDWWFYETDFCGTP